MSWRDSPLPDVPPEVGQALETAVKDTLAALEQAGVPAREADEFIRDCVFTAWWDWDYEGPSDDSGEPAAEGES